MWPVHFSEKSQRDYTNTGVLDTATATAHALRHQGLGRDTPPAAERAACATGGLSARVRVSRHWRASRRRHRARGLSGDVSCVGRTGGGPPWARVSARRRAAAGTVRRPIRPGTATAGRMPAVSRRRSAFFSASSWRDLSTGVAFTMRGDGGSHRPVAGRDASVPRHSLAPRFGDSPAGTSTAPHPPTADLPCGRRPHSRMIPRRWRHTSCGRRRVTPATIHIRE